MTDIKDVLARLDLLPEDSRAEILSLINALDSSQRRDKAKNSYLDYVRFMWDDFIFGSHHKIIAEAFDEIVTGKNDRLIICLPPRHTKSEFASIYLPSYFLGRYPNKKIIQASHTSELAVGYGRKVRALVSRPEYQEIFPGVRLSADSKAAGRWSTNKGGEYFAIGVGGAVAGKGADLFVIDDPQSEQEQIIGESNPAVYDRVMEWYEGGPRQRLQPGGAIVIVMTRWSKRDLVGQLLKKQIQEPGGDQWKVIEFPAILPSGNPVWPEYWTLDRLIATKNSIPISKWNAQYQQDPTAEEGALIKREHWKDWEQEAPPKNIELVIQSWDTALSSGTRANYSACTTWGIFKDENGEKNGVILLDAIRGKWEFPDLKEKALEHYKVWKPDICLIEARAAGAPLVYELRRMGIPVQDIAAGRGGRFAPNDKISRVNSVTDMFASGNVWAPKGKTWAQEVIEECAAFPAGENDDYVDTVVMALQRFRVGGWVANRNDEMDSQGQRRRAKTYY